LTNSSITKVQLLKGFNLFADKWHPWITIKESASQEYRLAMMLTGFEGSPQHPLPTNEAEPTTAK
jgi:hypothetical protein